MGHKSEPPKVFVFGEEDSSVAVRQFHEFAIDGALLKLADSENVVSIRA
jgi:hypothetical protein